MNATMALEGIATPSERLAFLAVPAKRTAEQVTGSANDLFSAIQTILDQIITDVCAKRTAEEFCAARAEHYPQYVKVMLALNSLISAVVPNPVVDRLAWESLSEMEADFCANGRGVFGQDISDQAIFSIWTLRKIHDLAGRAEMTKRPRQGSEEADQELAKKFVNHIIYTRFHLDCLKMSLRTGRIIYPDVLEPISESLRGLVNAYAYVRQAFGLREDEADEEVINIEFDDEEKELVGLSMKEVFGDA